MNQSETLVHVICGMEGEYSDRREWVLAVYRDEQGARKRVESMEAAVRVAVQQFPDPDDADELTVALQAIDPHLDGWDWDSIRYRVEAVPFLSSDSATSP